MIFSCFRQIISVTKNKIYMFSFFFLVGELGLFSLEKALGDLNAAFQYLKEGPQESWREAFYGGM